MFPKDSLEYKLLLRYTQKKTTTRSHPPQSSGVERSNDSSATQSPTDAQRKCKPKKLKLLKLITCIRPEKEDDYPENRRRRKTAAAYSCEYKNDFINAMTIIEH